MLETYRPSGRLGGGVVRGAMAAAAMMGAAGAVYQGVLAVTPSEAAWVVALVFLYATQHVVRVVLRWGHCRSGGAAVMLAMVGAIAGLAASHYVASVLALKVMPSWAEFEQYARGRVDQGWLISFDGQKARPDEPWRGPGVIAVWLVEAVLVLVGGLLGARWAVRTPYCEGCGRWADVVQKTIGVERPSPEDVARVGRATSIAELVVVGGGGASGESLVYSICGCPECQGQRTLSVKYETPGEDWEGRAPTVQWELPARVMLTEKDGEMLLAWGRGGGLVWVK